MCLIKSLLLVQIVELCCWYDGIRGWVKIVGCSMIIYVKSERLHNNPSKFRVQVRVMHQVKMSYLATSVTRLYIKYNLGICKMWNVEFELTLSLLLQLSGPPE